MTKARNLADLLESDGDVKSSALDNVSTDLVGDTTPQLGGNLDTNGNNITGTGNLNLAGTVTADGLTVDGNKIGISNAAPASVRSSDTVINMQDSFINVGATNINLSHNAFHNGTNWVRSTTDAVGHLQVANNQLNFFNSTSDTAGTTISFTKRMNIDGFGDISFYDSTGTTQGLFWDASQSTLRLGAYNGGGTPSGSLFVESNANNHAIHIEETGGNSESWQIGVNTLGDLGFYNSTSTTASVTFDDSGNVGIGTTTINDQLVVNSSSAEEGITIRGDNFDALKIGLVNPGTSNDGVIGMKISNALRFITNDTERMRITNGGNVGIGLTPAFKLDVYDSSQNAEYIAGRYKSVAAGSGFSETKVRLLKSNYGGDIGGYINQGVGHGLTFSSVSNNSPTERMRIDSSGNITCTSEGGTANKIDLRQGSAKMWAQYDQGSGTSLNDSYNVSSITDVSNGRARLAINNNMNNASYSTGGICDSAGNIVHQADPTTSQVDLRTQQTDGSNYDYDNVGPVIHGDLA